MQTTSKDLAPLFIVGQYKCGTSWLLKVLASHPQIVGINEIDIVRAACQIEGAKVRLRPIEERLHHFFDGAGWCTYFDGKTWQNTDVVARMERGESFQTRPRDQNATQKFHHLCSDTAHRLYQNIRKAKHPEEAMNAFVEATSDGWKSMDYIAFKAADQIAFFETLQAWQPQAKKILITRDGRDAAISAQHFTRLMNEKRAPWLGGKTNVRDYWDFLKAWVHRADTAMHYADQGQLQIIRYEDLSHNFHGVLRSLLEWLSLDHSDEIIEAIQARTSFEAMTGRPRGTEARHTIRKGAVGEWMEVLNDKEKEQAWHEAQRSLTALGYTQDGTLLPSPYALEGELSTPAPARLATSKNGSSAPFITASHNPVLAAEGLASTTIKWNTGSLSKGALYVYTSWTGEKLLAQGSRGEKEISWLLPGRVYEFRLYADPEQDHLLSTVTVRQEEGVTFVSDAQEVDGADV